MSEIKLNLVNQLGKEELEEYLSSPSGRKIVSKIANIIQKIEERDIEKINEDINLKVKAFEMAQKFCLLFEGKENDKVIELAKAIYDFLVSETQEKRDTFTTKYNFTTKECHKCGYLRCGFILSNGKIQWIDCIKCGYPNNKQYKIYCRKCHCIVFFDGKKQQQSCPWCTSEVNFQGL